jgi:hypothetical protein
VRVFIKTVGSAETIDGKRKTDLIPDLSEALEFIALGKDMAGDIEHGFNGAAQEALGRGRVAFVGQKFAFGQLRQPAEFFQKRPDQTQVFSNSRDV